jgi:hypothetical protein
MKTYKAFDADLSCRGFTFEVGKTYTHGGPVVVCQTGFHSCENPLDTLNYYNLTTSRFAVTEAGGETKTHDDDSKIAAAQITIAAELHLSDFIKACVAWITSHAKDAATTGNGANAATTGNGANAATTGDRANAATTGDRANAATTGYGANAATTGERANAATTGDRANAATTGDRANAATTGYGANAAVKGKNAIACSIGRNSTASAEAGGFIILVDYADDGTPQGVVCGKVGEGGLKPGAVYRARNGKAEEVNLNGTSD